MKQRLLCSALLLLVACTPEPEATISSFMGAPLSIDIGGSTTLTWESTAKECTISPGALTGAGKGSVMVSPTANTVYTLSCGSSSANVTIAVRGAVKVDEFTADPEEVASGSVSVLSWSAPNADGCTLTPGDVELENEGSYEATVDEETEFTLTCTGPKGPTSAKLTVSIATPTDLLLVPSEGTLTVTWKQPEGGSDLYLAEAAGITAENIDSLPGGTWYEWAESPMVIHGLVAGKTYYARVATAGENAEGPLSTEASATIPAATAGNDPLFSAQWHLTNTGQAGGTPGEDIGIAGAWAQNYSGAGIRIAVCDEGVEVEHEDLELNHASYLDYDYLDGEEGEIDGHATCVAGLSAARGYNNKGGRGVAPFASFVSYNIVQSNLSENEYDAMTRGKAQNHVSTNSWGDADDSTGLLTEADPDWVRGVAEGTSEGRGGKGTVYMWAAGNGADGDYVDDSNFDNQANSRFVLAVAGVGDDGIKVDYSEAGANVLITAQSGGRDAHLVTTSDLMGEYGYNDGAIQGEVSNPNYTNQMEGTSAATPIAAGVAGLVLQANPNLTWRDVRRVLAMSARKNDPTDSDWQVNGAGLHVNHKYGFGMVNADAAVRLAKTFTAGAVERKYSTALISQALAIPDNNATGASSPVTVSNSMIGHVEVIEVIIKVTHPRSGDLTLTLEHSGGGSSVLHPQHRCAPDDRTMIETCSDIDEFMFTTVRHLDEPADGTWTLKARDGRAVRTGTLVSWKMNIYGRP